MRNEYYGVASSNDFLAHYGIKGMKWGVRKAIEKGNAKALDKQYRKASRKLEKLSKKSDVNTQKELSKRYGKAAGVGLGIAGAGIGSNIGLNKLSRGLIKKSNVSTIGIKPTTIRENIIKEKMLKESIIPETKIRENIISGSNSSKKLLNGTVQGSKNGSSKITNNVKKANTYNKIGRVAQDVGIAALLASGVAGAKAIKAKRLSTAKGHAKAAAKYDSWKKQMVKAFKGTKYERLPSVQATRKIKHK